MAKLCFFLPICLLIVVGLPPSSAIPITNAISEMRVTGRLGCTLTGNPRLGLPTQPLVGANVTASCLAGTIPLGRVITDANGAFNIVYRVPTGMVFESSICTVRVTMLHILNCALLAPTRVLGSRFILTGLNRNPRGAVTALFNTLPFMVIS